MNRPTLEAPTYTPRKWDITVPIVTSGHHTDCYLSTEIDEPHFYNEVCHTLYTALRGDTITLHLNTPGGVIDSAFMVIDAIKRSKAKVTAHLTGSVASAGTIIALACDKLEVAPHTTFMIHNYSGGNFGKGHELKARQEHTDRALNAAFTDFYLGFLTEQEMQEVIEGRDIWMGPDEVKARWDIKTGKANRVEED